MCERVLVKQVDADAGAGKSTNRRNETLTNFDVPVMNLNMLRNMRWRVLTLGAGVAMVLIFEIAR